MNQIIQNKPLSEANRVHYDTYSRTASANYYVGNTSLPDSAIEITRNRIVLDNAKDILDRFFLVITNK